MDFMQTDSVKVLIVEDNPDDAALIEIELADRPLPRFALTLAASMADASRKLQDSEFDIALLDLSLPDTFGISTFKTFQALVPHLPVIILTGLNDEAVALEALRLGAQDYIVKSDIGRGLIVRAVRYAMERSRLESERNHLHHELMLKERLAAVGQTVASVSHYIKNVLSRMNTSQWLITKMVENEDYEKLKEVWPIFHRATDNLTEYVVAMLNFSRDYQPRLGRHCINELIREICALCQQDMDSNSLSLELDLDETAPVGSFDRSAMQDAILNLVNNSIDACMECGASRIHIGSQYHPGEDKVVISIEDDGLGIPAEVQSKIFDPFFSTKGSKGTGLGLPMVKKIAAAHGGNVTVDSQPGMTRFTITIPLHSDSPGEEFDSELETLSQERPVA